MSNEKWIVAVFENMSFAAVAVVKSRAEAESMSKIIFKGRRTLIWSAEETQAS